MYFRHRELERAGTVQWWESVLGRLSLHSPWSQPGWPDRPLRPGALLRPDIWQPVGRSGALLLEAIHYQAGDMVPKNHKENVVKMVCVYIMKQYTDKKGNKIFLICREIQMVSGSKSYKEGLPNIWGNAQIFSPYMRRPFVIYDFAPSEFPNLWGKSYFLFYQCNFQVSKKIFFFVSSLFKKYI